MPSLFAEDAWLLCTILAVVIVISLIVSENQ